MNLCFTVLGVAAPQGSMIASVSKAGRPFMRQANKRTMPWRQEVAAVAEKALGKGVYPIDGPVEFRATFYMPRPKGHFGKKGLRPSAPIYPSTKPDLSKLVRAAEDALTGIAYIDDSRIVKHVVSKVYTDSGESPRAAFEIIAL